MPHRYGALGLIAGLLFALPVAAQEDASDATFARARELFVEGVELTRQDRWGEALVYFQRSLALVERPNTIFNVAGILVRLGRGREAVEHYERYLRAAPADDPDRAAALAALEAARAGLARLHLSVSPAEADLRVDGLRVEGTGHDRELVLDPGEHVIDLYAPGFHREVFRVSFLPGARGERLITLVGLSEGASAEAVPEAAEPPPAARADPDAPAPPQYELRIDETPAHALLAAGLATLAVGAGALAWGLVEHEQVEDARSGERWAAYEERYARTQIVTPLGWALLAVGAGVASAGLAWLGALHLSVSVGPVEARLELRGRL